MNTIQMTGTLVDDFVFDHEYKGVKYYSNRIDTMVKEGKHNEIPIVVRENLIDPTQNYKNRKVDVLGSLRSWGITQNGKRRLLLRVVCNCVEEPSRYPNGSNAQFIGYLHKVPTIKQKTSGVKVSDVSIMIGSTNCIPCSAWNKHAKRLQKCSIGDKFMCYGFIENRPYKHWIDNDHYEMWDSISISLTNIDFME